MPTETLNLPHDWKIVGDIIVTITSPGDIGAADWARFIEDLKQPGLKRVFSLVLGAVTIDAVKRKQAADTVGHQKLEVTVITDNRLTRGVLTAISWMGANIKPFSWGDIEKAFERTGATEEQRRAITAIGEQFRAQYKE